MAIPGLEVTYPLTDAGPGNPNVPAGGSTQARRLRAEQFAAPPASAQATPAAAAAGPSTLRKAASALGNGFLYGGAGVAGALAASGLRDTGKSGPAIAVPGERQAGDSAGSTQIPVGGDAPAPNAQPYNFWTDSEVGRNAGNMANAVAPLGGVAMAARVPGAASRAFGVADAAATGLASGTRSERDGSAPTATLRPPGAAQVVPAPAAPNPTDQRLATGAQVPASPTAPASLRNDITRVGNEYSGGANVAGPITINGQQPGNGTISPQNMAAGNNLAATDSLRSQGAMLSGQSGGMNLPAAPTVRNSTNDWAARNNLRNMEVSASSITNSPAWSRGSTTSWRGQSTGHADQEGKVGAYQAALKNDQALQQAEPNAQLETLRSNNGLRGAQLSADASKENSRNSLRGTMYTADSQLGGKQMEMQQKLRQQQALGGIYQAAGGDPVKAAKLAASYGVDGKQFTDMAQAEQSRTQGNVKDARSTFDNMFTRDGKNGPERDENAEAMAHQLASQIVPGWETMSAEQRAQNRTKVVDATRVVQNMNSLRNTGWLQKAGIDAPTPAYSQLPDMGGARVSDVGMWEGLTTPEVRSGDKKISLRNGDTRYLPQGSLTESQLRLLQTNGAQRQ